MSQHNLQQEAESLAQYAADGSHTAFRRVVQAGLPLVMGTALRYTGGQLATAEDIAQMVFIDLARQAKSVRGATLSGWLHKHTCFTAAKVMRGERRRVLREQASVERTSSVPDSCPERLDDLLLGLGETDREALLLRYVEGRSHDEVGDALGISRAAAQKRAERALARLRVAFHSEQFTAGGLAAVMAPPMGGAADLANRMAGQAISAGSAPTIPFLAKPVTAFLWGAAAAITLAAVPLALGWRDYSAAKATAALSDPLGTGRSRAAEPHWSMADQMRVVPLPPAPSFSNPAAAVTALLEIADRFGVGNEGCSRATALVATLPQASIHDVLLGLERGMPATIRGTNWWAEVGRLLADRWRPRQVPDDLIAVWPMLSASTRMSLFKGCAETDLPATRRLLEGFDTELRLGSFGIKSQEYHNVLREAVLAQLLKDAPKEAAAFYGTMHRQYAWDSHLVGEPAGRSAVPRWLYT